MKKLLSILAIGWLAVQLAAGTIGGEGDARLYNTAYFDVFTKSQAPILDYIKYSKRASFDIKQYLDTVTRIKENYIVVKIHGRIIVPDNIKTSKVYINAGPNYYYHYGDWNKQIFYTSKNRQNAEFFLVDTKVDEFGKRYVPFKIVLNLYKPWELTPKSQTVPSTYIFSMAPKVRGFKNKFQPVSIYVLDE